MIGQHTAVGILSKAAKIKMLNGGEQTVQGNPRRRHGRPGPFALRMEIPASDITGGLGKAVVKFFQQSGL